MFAKISVALMFASASLYGAEKITYEDHIKDIFRDSCSSCHKPSKQKGGLDLMTYSALIKGSSSGVVLETGNMDSVLLECISWLDEDTRMPPKDNKLSDKEIDLIKQWVKGGLLESKNSRKLSAKSSVEKFVLPTVKEGAVIMPKNLSIEPLIRHDHAMPLQSMVASPSSPLVAISAYKQVLLFHSENLEVLGILDFPEGQVYQLQFSADGALLLAGGGMNGDRGAVVLWNVKTGERVKTIKQDYDVVMAADISSDAKYLATGSSDKLVRIYDVASGELLESFKKHAAWISALRFSPQGYLLASGDQNGQVVLWDLKEMDMRYNLYKHRGQINALSWRPDSKLIASASQDGMTNVWSVESGEISKQLKGHGGKANYDVHYNAKGHLLSTGGDNILRSWDTSYKTAHYNKQKLATMTKVQALSGSENYLTASVNGEFYLWDGKTKKELKRQTSQVPLLDERVYESEQQLAEFKDKELNQQKKLSEINEQLSELKNLPDKLTETKNELQKAQKLKELLRSTYNGAADAQLSSHLRNSQRQRRSEELSNIDKEIRSKQALVQSLTKSLKTSASQIKVLSAKKQKESQVLESFKADVLKHENDLKRWEREKINTERHVKKTILQRYLKDQENDQYDLESLINEGKQMNELQSEVRSLSQKIELRTLEIKRLESQCDELSKRFSEFQ